MKGSAGICLISRSGRDEEGGAQSKQKDLGTLRYTEEDVGGSRRHEPWSRRALEYKEVSCTCPYPFLPWVLQKQGLLSCPTCPTYQQLVLVNIFRVS